MASTNEVKRMRRGVFYRFVCRYKGSKVALDIPIIIRYVGMSSRNGEKAYEFELLWYEGTIPPGWSTPESIAANAQQIERFGKRILVDRKIVQRIERVDQEEVKKEVLLRAL